MQQEDGWHQRRSSVGWCCLANAPKAPTYTETSNKYVWNIENAFSDLHNGYASCNDFEARGEIWRLHVEIFAVKQCRVKKSYIAVYVEWKPSDNSPKECQISFKLKLKNLQNEELCYKQRCSHRFVPLADSGFTLFVPADEILGDTGPEDSRNGFSISFSIFTERDHFRRPSFQFGTYGFSVLAIFAVAVRYLYHIGYIKSTVANVNIQSGQREGQKLMSALKKIFRDIAVGSSDHIDLMFIFKCYGSGYSHLGKVFEFWEFFQYFTWRIGSFWSFPEEAPFHSLFVGNYVHTFNSLNATHLREFEVLHLDTVESTEFYEAINSTCSLEDGQPPIKPPELSSVVERSTQLSQFPPVLRLVIKRFKYDAFQNKNLKLLHSLEFPSHLKIDHHSFHHLAVSSSGLILHDYQLTAVIAHEGSNLRSGFYVTYLRSDDDIWIRLGETMSKIDETQMLESCARSACFLSYVKISDWDWVMNQQQFHNKPIGEKFFL